MAYLSLNKCDWMENKKKCRQSTEKCWNIGFRSLRFACLPPTLPKRRRPYTSTFFLFLNFNDQILFLLTEIFVSLWHRQQFAVTHKNIWLTHSNSQQTHIRQAATAFYLKNHPQSQTISCMRLFICSFRLLFIHLVSSLHLLFAHLFLILSILSSLFLSRFALTSSIRRDDHFLFVLAVKWNVQRNAEEKNRFENESSKIWSAFLAWFSQKRTVNTWTLNRSLLALDFHLCTEQREKEKNMLFVSSHHSVALWWCRIMWWRQTKGKAKETRINEIVVHFVFGSREKFHLAWRIFTFSELWRINEKEKKLSRKMSPVSSDCWRDERRTDEWLSSFFLTHIFILLRFIDQIKW